MSQKRKGKSLLEKVAKLAKASQESEKFDEEKSQYFKQMESAFERQNETESKDAFFHEFTTTPAHWIVSWNFSY